MLGRSEDRRALRDASDDENEEVEDARTVDERGGGTPAWTERDLLDEQDSDGDDAAEEEGLKEDEMIELEREVRRNSERGWKAL